MEEVVRDYLNGNTSLDELMDTFGLKKCDVCGHYELESDLIDTECLVGGGIGNVCESCHNDMGV